MKVKKLLPLLKFYVYILSGMKELESLIHNKYVILLVEWAKSKCQSHSTEPITEIQQEPTVVQRHSELAFDLNATNRSNLVILTFNRSQFWTKMWNFNWIDAYIRGFT